MSIYSGFATRQQQVKYNQHTQTLITVLFKRILRMYAGQETDQYKFKNLMVAIYDKMFLMEQSKYMKPKISNLVRSFLLQTAQIQNISSLAPKPSQTNLKHSFLDFYPKKEQRQKYVYFDRDQEETHQLKNQLKKKVNSNSSLKSTLYRFNKKISTLPQEEKYSSVKKRIKVNSMDKGLMKQAPIKVYWDLQKQLVQKKNKEKLTKKIPMLHDQQEKTIPQGRVSPREFLKQSMLNRHDSPPRQSRQSEPRGLKAKTRHQRIVRL